MRSACCEPSFATLSARRSRSTSAPSPFGASRGLRCRPETPVRKRTIRPAGHNAFNQLAECLIAHSAAMERGVNFEKFQAELFTQLESYVGREPETLARANTQRL